MVVADVYNHRFHKIYKRDDGLNHIMEKDDIFVQVAFYVTHIFNELFRLVLFSVVLLVVSFVVIVTRY